MGATSDPPITEDLSRRAVLVILLISTCCKILLQAPSVYRSTDFDVHRHWLALTTHVPMKDWYVHDYNDTATVHTLDYPPSFAYFEYLLGNNPITHWLLENDWLDSRCLALLPDTDNAPSDACIKFHRSTVLVADLLLWWGAAVASSTFVPYRRNWTILLVVLHPGLLWLDHVHFQYNGMLLGILLLSLGYIQRGLNDVAKTNSFVAHVSIGFGAVLYCLLVTLKHLYLFLAPLYLVVLLKFYCLGTDASWWTSGKRFVGLGILTLTTLVLPLLPFLTTTQLSQLVARLFPFGRGLVHDYWAANVWALYLLVQKVLRITTGLQIEEPIPLVTAILLVISLLPALYWIATYKNNKQSPPQLLLASVTYISLSAFMLAYHVHEKAIMTTLLPLTLLASRLHEWAPLALVLNALGLLGLMPLLFRPQELLFKVTTSVGYLGACAHVWKVSFLTHGSRPLTRVAVYSALALYIGVAVFQEVLHPLLIYPRMEFLPLLLVSVSCAVGLFVGWVQVGRLLHRVATSHTAS